MGHGELWQDVLSNPSRLQDTRIEGSISRDVTFKLEITKKAIWTQNMFFPCRVEAKQLSMAQPLTQHPPRFKQHPSRNIELDKEHITDGCNRDVSILCQKSKLNEAMDIVDVMEKQGIDVYNSTYVCLLQQCTQQKSLADGKRIHAQLIQNGCEEDIILLTDLVRMYVKCGSMTDARQVFEKMRIRHSFLWNILIAGYIENHCDTEALNLLRIMQDTNVCLYKLTIPKILKACANLKAMEEGKWVHAHILKNRIELNVFVGSSLVNMYAKCGNIEDACKVFDMLPERDLVLWNAMISGYVQHGHTDEAFKLFQSMDKEGLAPDVITWNSLIAAFAQNGNGKDAFRFFQQMQQAGVKPDVVSWTSMIAGYVQHGQLDEALELFHHMQDENVKASVATWNTLISGYVQQGCFEEALALFSKMVHEGVKPDVVSWTSIISEYAKQGHVEQSLDLLKQMKGEGVKADVVCWNALIAGFSQQGFHKAAIELFQQMQLEGVKPNISSWNALIAGYLQNRGCEEALHLFQKMRLEGMKPDIVSWNTIIAGYAREGCYEVALILFQQMQDEGVKTNVVTWNGIISGYIQHQHSDEALKLFWLMQKKGVKPDTVTFTNILSACTIIGSLEQGRMVHDIVVKCGLESNLYIANAVIYMYTKCGSIEDAFKVFDRNPNRDVASWNVIIGGHAMHGQGKKALELFQKMEEDGVEPNQATFTAILSACSNMGLVDEGLYYFDIICRIYCFIPTNEHYACMVSLLGYQDRPSDVVELITKMPFEPDAMLWRTFLVACKMDGYVELAKSVANCALKLEPENSGPYVLLSNMYAASGKWMDQANVRKVMDDVVKEP